MSAGINRKPHIVRCWVPRQGRFVYHALPVVTEGFQLGLTHKQRELNRRARNWCAEQNVRAK